MDLHRFIVSMVPLIAVIRLPVAYGAMAESRAPMCFIRNFDNYPFYKLSRISELSLTSNILVAKLQWESGTQSCDILRKNWESLKQITTRRLLGQAQSVSFIGGCRSAV